MPFDAADPNVAVGEAAIAGPFGGEDEGFFLGEGSCPKVADGHAFVGYDDAFGVAYETVGFGIEVGNM